MPVIVKYGGNAMTDRDLRRRVAAAIHDLARQGRAPVVVHGGGPFIARALDEAGIEHRFLRGLRVTTEASLPVIERTLTLLGKELAQEIGSALGLTGRDARSLVAKRLDPEWGWVGRMESVNAPALRSLLAAGLTPVLACLALDAEGLSPTGMLNVNADEVAGFAAGALKAPVLFLTNVPGVLDRPEDAGSLLASLPRRDILVRIADGRIAGGMIPKVEAALAALERGAAFAIIADGRDPGVLAAALAGERGTRILPD